MLPLPARSLGPPAAVQTCRMARSQRAGGRVTQAKGPAALFPGDYQDLTVLASVTVAGCWPAVTMHRADGHMMAPSLTILQEGLLRAA
jgi:hypothetical protein